MGVPGRRSSAILLLVAVLVGGAGCRAASQPSGSAATAAATATPRAPGGPSAALPSASPSLAEARIADLESLHRELRRIHPAPWSVETEARFLERSAAVAAVAGTLSDVGFLMAVMDLTGHRPQDGHTGTFPMAQTNDVIGAWPIWLWHFPDGYRIVAAREPLEDLVGARVIRIGSLTPEAVATAVEPLVPRDNASSLRANHPIWLTIPEILTELGAFEGGTPIGLTVELDDGSVRDVAPERLAMPDYWAWILGVYGDGYPGGLPPDPDGPLHGRHRDQAFWTATLDGGALYVGYHDIARSSPDGTTIEDLAAAVTLTADAGDPVIIDLRNDPGGDNGTYGPLRVAVEAAARDHPGRVALLAGRSTFSAAGNFITDLELGPAGADILLVGEPPGGGLNVWGNAGVTTLPDSGIVVIIASRAEVRAPGDPRDMLPVDIPVETTWAAHAAGQDPVLEAALAAIAAGD